MAATDSRPVPLKNTAFRVYAPILDADGDPVTGATSLDSEVSLDGAAFADCTNEATEIGTSGIYYLDLTASEMNADAVIVRIQTATSGAKTTVLVFYPEEAGDINVDVTAFGGSAGTFSGGRPEVNATHAAGTAWGSGAITAASIAADAITAAKIADGAIDAATFAAGAINAAAIAADAITDAKVAADVTIASVTGAVGSVTGNVGGNVTGSVGSIATGGITAASFASGAIDAAAIAADAIGSSELAATAVAEIADQVWDEVLSGHLAAGSTGEALNAAGAAGDPWTTALPGAYGAGSAGKIIGDNINATISSRASQTSVDTVDDFLDTEIAAIKAKTDNLPASPAATGDIPSAAAVADAVWDEATTGHVTSGTFGEQLKTDVDAILDDTGTAGVVVASLAAGSVTAAAIATDAIDADAIAASAVTEIQSGLSTLDAAGIRTAVGLASANLDTQLAAIDDFLDTEIAAILAAVDTEVGAIKTVTDQLVAAQSEPSAAPAANATPLAKIAWLAALARNKVIQSATTQTLKADDGTTTIATATVSDDGSQFERSEWA